MLLGGARGWRDQDLAKIQEAYRLAGMPECRNEHDVALVALVASGVLAITDEATERGLTLLQRMSPEVAPKAKWRVSR